MRPPRGMCNKMIIGPSCHCEQIARVRIVRYEGGSREALDHCLGGPGLRLHSPWDQPQAQPQECFHPRHAAFLASDAHSYTPIETWIESLAKNWVPLLTLTLLWLPS